MIIFRRSRNSLPLISFFVLLFGCFIVLGPIYWMVVTSLKSVQEIFQIPLTMFPHHVETEAYRTVLSEYSFGIFFKNSIIVVLSATSLTLAAATFAGFGCSRFVFKGRVIFLVFILITQMFPSAIMLIPYFKILRTYGLINKYLGLILVYISFQTPLCTWLMYGYFKSIPIELDDAAAIDGLGKFRTFAQIVLPLSLPGLASTAIYSFVNSWNEFQFALVLTTSDQMKTVSVGVGQMIEDTKVNWNDMMAASILASIPLILIFLFFQRYFFAGLTAGSVKQ